MTYGARRFAAAGALAVAAVAAPLTIVSSTGGSADVQAQCRAHFGNIEDNICMDGPDNGNNFNVGTPSYGGFGSNNGVRTGPVFPNHTWTGPIS